jgi:TPR repeat protein
MWYLAEAYMGTYVPKDMAKVKYWYGRADELGCSEASFMLGRICLQQREINQAFAAYSRSASRGYLPAIYRLAKMYGNGTGTKKDINQSRLLLEKAASKGHLFAKRDLATLSVSGAFGVLPIARGLLMLAFLVFDVAGLAVQAVRHGPTLDDRLLG